MTPTRTYKIIDHFKSGKCVMVKHRTQSDYDEATILSWLLAGLRYELNYPGHYTFRLINKKGRRG